MGFFESGNRGPFIPKKHYFGAFIMFGGIGLRTLKFFQ